MCHLRWGLRLASLLILLALLTITRPSIVWAVREWDLKPQLYVTEFVSASNLPAYRWAILFAHIALDLIESFFTERNRWSCIVGGRKRCLPLMDQLCMNEIGFSEFRIWKLVRWYCTVCTCSTVPIHVIIVIHVGSATPETNPSFTLTDLLPGGR